jgi:hypothetical protein
MKLRGLALSPENFSNIVERYGVDTTGGAADT